MDDHIIGTIEAFPLMAIGQDLGMPQIRNSLNGK